MFISSLPDMNKILSELILGSCVSISLMPDKLLMEHVMLLAILTSHIGTEVGEWNTVSLHATFATFDNLVWVPNNTVNQNPSYLKSRFMCCNSRFPFCSFEIPWLCLPGIFLPLVFTSKWSLGGYIHLSHISTQIFLFLNKIHSCIIWPKITVDASHTSRGVSS